MSRTTVETVTCDRCHKKKEIIDGKKLFDRNNVFHYDVVNPTNKSERVDLCHDCFTTLRNLWVSFIIADGF